MSVAARAEAKPRVGQLQRALTALTNGALTFAGVGVFAGLFSLYGFSMNVAGGAMFWGWPIVAITVGAMVLVFAELASHYPFAGSMYQWPTILMGKRVGWVVGWLYLGALIPLMTAYAASEPVVVRPLLGLQDSFQTDFIIIFLTLLFAVIWGLGAVKYLGRIAEYAVVIEIAIVCLVVIAVFVLGPKDFGNLTNAATVVTSGTTSTVQGFSSFGDWLPLFLGGGIFTAYWVLYTFENGGTLGEETIAAERNAPQGVIGAYIFVVVVGFIFLIGLTVSVPDLKSSMVNYSPAQDAIANNLPGWVLKLFLGTITFTLLIATAAMFMAAVRHIYGMARDSQIPFSGFLSKTSSVGSPWAAVLSLGVLSLLPVIIFTTNTASIVGAATAAMYISYFAVMVVALIARLRGWPWQLKWFRLGRWSLLVNVVAVIGIGLNAINLMWPRALTNPTFDQIAGTTTSNLFRQIPMGWYLIGVPVLVGIVYYAIYHRRLYDTPLELERKLDERGWTREHGILGPAGTAAAAEGAQTS